MCTPALTSGQELYVRTDSTGGASFVGVEPLVLVSTGAS